MRQLDTINPTASQHAAPTQVVRDFLRHWLTGRRGLILGGFAIVAAGLALGWNWLSAIGVAPIILSLAPCAAMCAVGACAMKKASSVGAKPSVPDQATTAGSMVAPVEPDDGRS